VSDRLRFVGDHVEYLASGQALAPGDYLDAADLTTEDKWLRDEGRFIEAPEPTDEERAQAEHDQLVAQAKALDISGRTKMRDDELRAAIAEREADGGER
jgi:hypothetical protein